jgi:hypothetical protein
MHGHRFSIRGDTRLVEYDAKREVGARYSAHSQIDKQF